MSKRGITDWLLLAVKGIIKSGGWLSAYVFLAGMLILVTSDPILRYLVGSPIYWSNEVSTFLMLEMAFAGLAITFARGRHIRVTLLFNKLPRKAQNVLWIIVTVVSLIITGMLSHALIKLGLYNMQMRVVSPTAELALHYWQLMAAASMIVLMLALVLFLIRKIYVALGRREVKEDEIATIEITY